MCGLVGIITGYKNGFSQGEVDMLQQLIYIDTLRGVDATGLMYGDTYNNVQVHKEATPGPAFLKTKEWFSSKQEILHNGLWAFAHNRAATRGEKTDGNAHPFVVDDIILMQNGTYRGSHKHHKDVDVDTEACAHVIAENDDVEKALQKIDAAYAFIWWSNKNKTINIIRNHERPLCIARSENGSLYFASEGDMLYLTAHRNGIKFNKDGVVMLETEKLYTFSFDTPNYKFTEASKKLDCTFRREQAKRQPLALGWTSTNPQRATLMECAGMLNTEHHTMKKNDEVVEMRKHFSTNKELTFLVEGIDYFPVSPNDYNSTEFYMFGCISSPCEYNGCLVGWTVNTANYLSAQKYINDNLFLVTVDYVIQRGKANSEVWQTLIVAKTVETTQEKAIDLYCC